MQGIRVTLSGYYESGSDDMWAMEFSANYPQCGWFCRTNWLE